ncbi:MAG: hypothetical protein GY859_01250, partial [Desulfobacterales bacterium]|nr:hypothetical protein [Desulfobacterales bacterium]
MSHKSPPDDLKSVMDGIDLRVLSLLDQRMAAALEMGDIKGQPGKEMRDSPGEALVAENLSNRSPRNLVPEEFKEVCSALSRLSGQRRGETEGL